MTLRLSAFLGFLLCLVGIFYAGNAWATCASIGSASTASQEISNEATNKLREIKNDINKQLQTASDNFIEATKAASTANTSAVSTLTQVISDVETSNNSIKRNNLINEKMLDTTMDMKPLIEECISLSGKSRTGIEMDEITRAAETSMNAVKRLDYTNDINSPYAKGVTSALSIQFIEYLQYYCNPDANNGNMPTASNPIKYTHPKGTPLAGQTVNIYCGQGRESLDDNGKFLIDADIRIDNTIFSDKTWPKNEGDNDYGSRLYAAANQGARLLSPSPRDPFKPSAFEGNSGIEAFMERRAFEARSDLANSQFNYIAAKRVPASADGGLWIKDMLAKELAQDKEAVLNANGGSLSEKMTSYCGNSTEGSCGMWQLVKQISDSASKNEYMNFVMRDRFLGTEYLASNNNNTAVQSQRQQIDLLALDLIQQREINETLERILGTMAAKYALRIDQTAKESTVGMNR